MNTKSFKKVLVALFVFAFSMYLPTDVPVNTPYAVSAAETVPAYTGSAYTVINNNVPAFSEADKKRTDAFETYSDLDALGRCRVAYANICPETEPTEERGDISSVHPTGWQSGMNWERCHLIGFQLAGENANEKNLITGTHYFNVTGMLPFENMVDDYVDETGNHVLYRVTPCFSGAELVARGVYMEAWSVEDNGDGICFYVYVHNVAPGYTIDYATGVVSNAQKSASKITLTGKSAVYSGSAISIGKAVVTGSTGKVTYTYYTDKSCKVRTTTKNGASSTGGAPKYVGTYYVKAQVAADDNYSGVTSSAVTLKINKAANSITKGTYTKTYVFSSKGHSYTIKAKAKSGAVTYKKISGSKKISMSKTGKITVPKKLKIGTYKITIRVTSKGTSQLKGTSVKKTVKIVVRKSVAAKKKTSVSSTSSSSSTGSSSASGSSSSSNASGSSASSGTSASTVYWTSGGSVYHKTPDCPSLSRSKTICSGSIAESGKSRACERCY